MVLVEERRHHDRGDDREAAEPILALGEAAADRGEPAQPIGGEHRRDRERQQADDERLPLGREQRDQIERGERQRGRARQQGSARALPLGHALRPAR